MFAGIQKKTLREAWFKRARRERGLAARIMRNMSEADADKVIAQKEAKLRNRYPRKGDGEILAMLLEWISSGGLEQILAFIVGILTIV